MTIDISVGYDAVLKQMAAEAYLEGVTLATDPDDVIAALKLGNNRPSLSTAGFTKFTGVQAVEFVAKYQVIRQASDFAGNAKAPRSQTAPFYYAGTSILANTGLSVTLIREKNTNKYTLAIRSTENRTEEKGGDRQRDTFGADKGIFSKGTLRGQRRIISNPHANVVTPLRSSLTS